jgi:1A family penicillin-binding protein
VPLGSDTTDEPRAPDPAPTRPLDADARWSAVVLAAVAAVLAGGARARRAGWRLLEWLDLTAAELGRRGRAWIADREGHWDREELRPGATRGAAVRTLATAVAIVALLAGALVTGGRATMAGLAAGTTGGVSDRLVLPPLAERTELFAADGSSLGVVHADHGNRVVVPLDAVPKVVVDAVVATEDADYWNHDGIDMSGVARAAKRNVDAGGVAEGGSTITQQLAKSTMTNPQRDLHRKLTEAVLAVRLDDELGKSGVLERYLNTIFLGHGAYGIAAAAEAYFARPVAELTADQAALLAGLIRGPNLYDPITNPEAAAARRATVLDQMVAEGFLSAEEAAVAAQAPLPTAIHRPPPATGWIADAARAELLADPRMGETPEARASTVSSGGLRVHTTVDPALQDEAQDAVRAGLPRGTEITAALAAVDPATGAVRALVGGDDYGARQFNAARDGAGRQTGSAFKVFTLVTALRAGHVSSEPIDGNSPCPIPNPGGTPDPWLPENYEGHTFGQLTLADATAQSSNCAFARLASSVEVEAVARTAQEMGVQAPLQPVPSMTLGTSTVPPLQMAAAYATLAADGVARTPHVVSRVEAPDGRVLLENDGAPRSALDPQVARVATSVLRGVVTAGTGKAAALADRPVAGKTGTAQDYQDAWFVGYTPQLATAVWMGDPNGERPMRGVGGIDVTGGSYPARIWRQFMHAAHEGLPVVDFAAPAPEPPPPAVTPAPTAVADDPSSSPRRPKGGKGKRKD